MPRPLTLALLLLLAGSPGRAEPLDAAAFEALTGTRTLRFSSVDGPYGAEQFLPGRRSLWRFEGEATCRAGSWSQQGDAICFRYEGEAGPSCWRMERTAAGLTARMVGDDPDAVLTLSAIDDTPLPCPHPGTGS